MSLPGLADKIAVVTGAGAGIGAATARRLSREGARVVLVDLNGDRAADVAAGLPGESLAVAADVALEQDVDRYIAEAVERFGRVDLHHLNAGIAGSTASFPELEAADFDRVIAVNLRGVFLGLRAAFRLYEAQGEGGAIVVTASLASDRGSADLIPYHASKHGVAGLVRSAAVHGGPIGVRVNAVAPGIVLTDAVTPGGGGPGAAARARKSALGRPGEVGEVAALVSFLLSSESRLMTGAIVAVDGGASALNPTRFLGE